MIVVIRIAVYNLNQLHTSVERSHHRINSGGGARRRIAAMIHLKALLWRTRHTVLIAATAADLATQEGGYLALGVLTQTVRQRQQLRALLPRHLQSRLHALLDEVRHNQVLALEHVTTVVGLDDLARFDLVLQRQTARFLAQFDLAASRQRCCCRRLLIVVVASGAAADGGGCRCSIAKYLLSGSAAEKADLVASSRRRCLRVDSKRIEMRRRRFQSTASTNTNSRTDRWQ